MNLHFLAFKLDLTSQSYAGSMWIETQLGNIKLNRKKLKSGNKGHLEDLFVFQQPSTNENMGNELIIMEISEMISNIRC